MDVQITGHISEINHVRSASANDFIKKVGHLFESSKINLEERKMKLMPFNVVSTRPTKINHTFLPLPFNDCASPAQNI